eukprot:19422-Heterococcus_DN1.PRE.2
MMQRAANRRSSCSTVTSPQAKLSEHLDLPTVRSLKTPTLWRHAIYEQIVAESAQTRLGTSNSGVYAHEHRTRCLKFRKLKVADCKLAVSALLLLLQAAARTVA